MFLAKDVSPWLRNNDKTKSKTFCEIARYFAECFGLEESVAIVMGGLKSTPIVCCASRILFPNCFSLRLIDISYMRSEEHTSELQSRPHLVCRLLLEKKKI